MKINKKLNHLMVWLTIIDLILRISISFLHINKVHLDTSLSYFINGIIEITYILMLLYLISVLKFVGEAIAVQVPFWLYLGIEVAMFISGFISSRSQITLLIFTSIGAIKIIDIVYIAIMVFKIKNQRISVAFKIYGLSLIFVFVIVTSIPFLLVMTNHVGPLSMLKHLRLIDILPLIAVLFIIDKTGEYLENYQIAVVD